MASNQNQNQRGYPSEQKKLHSLLPSSLYNVPLPNNVIIQGPSTGRGYQIPGIIQPIPYSPPGLEYYLKTLDHLLVQQKVQLLEIFSCVITSNKYTIMDGLGQRIFFADEDSDCIMRNFYGNSRPFDMRISDNFGNQVMNLSRPLACRCFPGSLHTMEVSAPPGNVIGIIEQQWSIFVPSLIIKNATGDIIFYIKGTCFTFRCFTNANFKIYARDGETEVGEVSKKWMGCVRESLIDAGDLSVTFPIDLDVKMKATLLGALFLIDYMYFGIN